MLSFALVLAAVFVAVTSVWQWFQVEEATAAAYDYTHDATMVTLLRAPQHPNLLDGIGGSEVVIANDTLVSAGPVGDNMVSNTKGKDQIAVYTVREGDTLSHVAEVFGVTTNTILWANDLTSAVDIRPGQVLVILPVAGVQHNITSGDTITTLAKQYDAKADEILSYNEMADASELAVGDTIIIPGGTLHSVQTRAASVKPVKISGTVAGASTSGYFTHPAPGATRMRGVTSGHRGVDLAAGAGTPILAAAAGEVIESKSSGYNGGFGRYIKIRHNNGAETLYAHLMRNDVGVGTWVAKGEVIGGMGNTGKTYGPTGVHLHFEVRGARNPF